MPRISDGDRPVVMWFRRDLRLSDNPALAAAAAQGPVVPVFLRPEGAGERRPGAASLWWLDRSLRALGAELSRRGSPLILRSGDPAEALLALARETSARSLVFNHLWDGPERDAEARASAALRAEGVEVQGFHTDLLSPPGGVVTGAGRAYQVFTPFWRALRADLRLAAPIPAPDRLSPPASPPPSQSLDAWSFQPRAPDWSVGFNRFTPGETAAHADLDAFASDRLKGYADHRNRPDLPATSRLSPRLHWGELGPAQVWRRAEIAASAGRADPRDLDSFLSELAWRDFNHHLMAEAPDLIRRNFRTAFDAFPWRSDPGSLTAWRRGETGYPLVDAGLRELWATGFMHNRVRMVVGSFLVKHLLLDWREGERWFWDTLLDASPANNVMNWQWIAGCGADAAPYFRIFNPVAQGRKFDPDGDYVRTWIPEISALPTPFIHAPWTAPPLLAQTAGVRLGSTYPPPCVDHDFARRRALAAFEQVRRAAAG